MKKRVRVGSDVASRELVVATDRAEWTFGNDPDGHRQLIRKLTKGGREARVVVEATGVYHLDLGEEAGGAEVIREPLKIAAG